MLSWCTCECYKFLSVISLSVFLHVCLQLEKIELSIGRYQAWSKKSIWTGAINLKLQHSPTWHLICFQAVFYGSRTCYPAFSLLPDADLLGTRFQAQSTASMLIAFPRYPRFREIFFSPEILFVERGKSRMGGDLENFVTIGPRGYCA